MTSLVLSSGGLPSERPQDPAFRRFLVVSAVVHIVLLGLSASATLFHAQGVTYSPAYTVDLVSLPPAPPAAPPAAKAAAPAPYRPATAAPSEAPAKEPSVRTAKPAPAAPAKPRLPAPTVAPSKGGEEEAAAVQKRARLRELERDAQRLYESIRSAAGAAGAATPSAPASSAGPSAAAKPSAATASAAGAAAGGGGERPADLRLRAYYDRVWGDIKAAWVLPGGVEARDSRLLTVVGIRIAADGTLQHVWLEKESGNIYYDQSALRAISKASPLPPLPRDLGVTSLELGINFRVTE